MQKNCRVYYRQLSQGPFLPGAAPRALPDCTLRSVRLQWTPWPVSIHTEKSLEPSVEMTSLLTSGDSNVGAWSSILLSVDCRPYIKLLYYLWLLYRVDQKRGVKDLWVRYFFPLLTHAVSWLTVWVLSCSNCWMHFYRRPDSSAET